MNPPTKAQVLKALQVIEHALQVCDQSALRAGQNIATHLEIVPKGFSEVPLDVNKRSVVYFTHSGYKSPTGLSRTIHTIIAGDLREHYQ